MPKLHAEIEVKNYRCFSDTEPLRFNVIDGLVAVVGQNNSGKTTFLKFIVELRHVWNLLYSERQFLRQSNGVTIGFHGPSDQSEVFHNQNDRPISIVLNKLALPESNSIQSIRLELSRGSHVLKCISAVVGSSITLSDPAELEKLDQYDASGLQEVGRILGGAFYFESQRTAHQQGVSFPEMLSGQQVLQTWSAYKTGTVKKDTRTALEIEKFIARVFGFETLQINTAINSAELQLVIDDQPFRLSEVGAGIEQFIVTVINLIAKNPTLVLIDEPERGLHPALQRELINFIASKSNGRALFATHSVGLARTMADAVYVSKRSNKISSINPFESVIGLAEYLGELSFSSWREFGCDAVLLVEGPKDIRTMLSLLSQHVDGTRIAILPVGGSQLLDAGCGQDLAELKRIHSHIFVLIDRETDSLEKTEPKRLAFIKECDKLGITCCMLERRAIENYFTADAIRNVISDSARALEPYERFAGSDVGWGKNDGWKIAKEIKWKDLQITDLGAFISKMLAVIK